MHACLSRLDTSGQCLVPDPFFRAPFVNEVALIAIAIAIPVDKRNPVS
jgi:hypothetical protein